MGHGTVLWGQRTSHIVSSVVCHNGDAKHALKALLYRPENNDALAIAFCNDLPQERDAGRAAVNTRLNFAEQCVSAAGQTVSTRIHSI